MHESPAGATLARQPSEPLVSVIMPTFNHEKFVAEAIESVLNQTFESFELVIINDGSIDDTHRIVRSFQDDRIVYLSQRNQGLSVALNNGILASSGEYIAIFSGDDVCDPKRLEDQYSYLARSGTEAMTCWAEFIDEEGRYKDPVHFPSDLFNQPDLSRAEMLHRFFMKGNYLLAVGAMVNRELLMKAGLFRTTSLQLQDFEMWIELMKRTEIHMLPRKLVKYRVREGDTNLSSPSNDVRTHFEQHEVRKTMLDGVPIELFREAFSSELRKPAFSEGIEFELEKAFLYLSHADLWTRSIGAGRLFELLKDDAVLDVASSEYQFDLADLFELSAGLDVPHIVERTSLSSDLKRVLRESEEAQTNAYQAESDLSREKARSASLEAEIAATRSERDGAEELLALAEGDLARWRTTLEDGAARIAELKDQISALEGRGWRRLFRRS